MLIENLFLVLYDAVSLSSQGTGYPVTPLHIPEERNSEQRSCENLKAPDSFSPKCF
jgi:hypothetical protein